MPAVNHIWWLFISILKGSFQPHPPFAALSVSLALRRRADAVLMCHPAEGFPSPPTRQCQLSSGNPTTNLVSCNSPHEHTGIRTIILFIPFGGHFSLIATVEGFFTSVRRKSRFVSRSWAVPVSCLADLSHRYWKYQYRNYNWHSKCNLTACFPFIHSFM